MSPDTGTNFVVSSYYRDDIIINKAKMVEHKLVSFVIIVAFWTPVTLLITLIRVLSLT